MQATASQITISGKNLAVTPALEAHASQKVSKALRSFDGHDAVRADVVLQTDRRGHTAEVTVTVGGYFLRGEYTSPDMYHSINQAVERIEGQVRKFKARLERQRRANGSIRHAVSLAEEETGGAPRVVRRKRFVVKPMDVEEAILQMELLGHDFFIFVRDDTFNLNVLYRRKDGKYGILEPIPG